MIAVSLLVGIVGAVLATLRSGAARVDQNAKTYWEANHPHLAAAWAEHPIGSAVPAVFVCTSCDGSIVRHSDWCPQLTGAEARPVADAREVTTNWSGSLAIIGTVTW